MKIGFSAKRRPFHVAFTVASLSVYLLHVLCRTPSARPQERTSLLQESPDDHGEEAGDGPSPAALQPVPAGVAVTRAVVRLERRSLQELLAEHTPVTGSGDGGKRTTSDQPTPTPALSTPHSTTRAPRTPITTTPIHHLPPLSFSSPLLTYLSPAHRISLNPRDKVLGLCGQTQPLPLTDFFTQQMVESVHKLGEGTFSEVFGCVSDTGTQLAVKVIPIEGDQLYNDERQTTYEEVLTEMVITKELSQLEAQENASHFTENFLQIHRVTLAQGEYPVFLLKSWDSYAKTHVVENDRPDSFPAEQLYVVMAVENAGSAVESYQFSSVEEAVSVVGQVAGALAVGETALEMEHRDLHLSNILVRKTKQKSFTFRLDNQGFSLPSHGVKATVVDYTLSRVKQDECVSYHDLEQLPWLFEGRGDLQFDVYRDMRKITGGQWEKYHPSTNVMWLAFLATKLSDRALQLRSTARRSWRAALRPIARRISTYPSAHDAFVHLFSSDN
ncbi:Serine/threonine-protein kinase haspin [Geodia barretti]|uniref:non-specific serine/threonine protein kinase n=1 Tax=Geodia barretti TaxID=519541 RepID=A0AA35X751_GEOBA|nr:Serine/threonine-protein kinase haspin [Geodia barretti]